MWFACFRITGTIYACSQRIISAPRQINSKTFLNYRIQGSNETVRNFLLERDVPGETQTFVYLNLCNFEKCSIPFRQTLCLAQLCIDQDLHNCRYQDARKTRNKLNMKCCKRGSPEISENFSIERYICRWYSYVLNASSLQRSVKLLRMVLKKARLCTVGHWQVCFFKHVRVERVGYFPNRAMMGNTQCLAIATQKARWPTRTQVESARQHNN